MPRGAKPGERRGGRAKGTPNKITRERALQAEREVQNARVLGRKLAKDVLDDFMHVFAGMAQRWHPNNPQGDIKEFERWALHAVEAARALAPYQSPTYRAIVVANSARQIDITMELKPAIGQEDRSYRDGNVIEFQRSTQG